MHVFLVAENQMNCKSTVPHETVATSLTSLFPPYKDQTRQSKIRTTSDYKVGKTQLEFFCSSADSLLQMSYSSP